MFGLDRYKQKKKLVSQFAVCFESLCDELGNVPVALQHDPFVHGAITGICHSYLQSRELDHLQQSAIDAIYEELFRRESVEVQYRVDKWQAQGDVLYQAGIEQIKHLTGDTDHFTWLSSYLMQNFKREHNLML